jgi:hypothetical protein
MKDYFYLNPSKMVELSKILGNSEIKMMLGIMYCLSTTGEKWFVNNVENRSRMASIGFDKTPERISTLLGSITKKGVLKREANGVYSLPENLFIAP